MPGKKLKGFTRSIRKAKKQINEVFEELQSSTVSREYHDNIIKSMPGMLTVINPDATIRTINQSLLNILGYKKQELIGKHISAIIAEEEEEEEFSFEGIGIEDLTKKGFIQNIRKKYLAKNGTKIPVSFSGSVMKDKEGKIEGIVCIAIDITIQKKAEAELKKSEEKFRTVYNASTDAFYMIDPEKDEIVDVNTKAHEMLGYSKKELCSLGISDIHKHELDKLKEFGKEIAKNSNGQTNKLSCQAKDGRKIPVEILYTKTIILGRNLILASVRDISERLKQEKLKESESKFRGLFEAASVGIIIVNQNGNIVLYNKIAESIFGYTANEMAGKSIEMLVPQKFKHDHQKQRDKYFKKPAMRLMSSGLNLQGLHKSGSQFPMDIALSYFKTEEGTFAVCYVEDITKRKEIEEERAKLTAAAAEKKRSKELAKINKELLKAEEKIKTSLHEKEILLREVNHRVKNNMQVILSLMKLQSHTIKDAKLLDVFKLCQNRIKSMAIVHEELGNSPSYKRIDFARLARRLTVNIFDSFNISTNDIKLELDNDYVELGIAESIPSALIINELVTNSLKYAFPNEKKGKIFVGCKSDGKTVKLTISDNGIGLPDHVNFREPKSVGLQLVNDLAFQLKARLNYDDSEGTTFHISFDRKQEMTIDSLQ